MLNMPSSVAPIFPPPRKDSAMDMKLGLRPSVVAAACAALLAGAAFAQTPAAAAAARASTRGGARRPRTGLDLHQQHRHLQPIRVPRHFADQRKARRPGRLRREPQERLLCRHLALQRQLALRLPMRRVEQPRMGHVRRLQVGPRSRLRVGQRLPLLLLPWQLSVRIHESRHHRVLHRAQLEDAAAEVELSAWATRPSASPTRAAATTSKATSTGMSSTRSTTTSARSR